MDDGGDNDLSITSDDEDSISTTGDIGDFTTSAEELGSHMEQNSITVTQLSQVESTNDEEPSLLRRSARRKFPPNRYAHDAHAAISKNISEIPQDLLTQIYKVYHAETTDSLDTTKIDPLLPTPDNWKQILSYPPHIKILWIKSFVKELKELIKKGTVIHEIPNKDDAIIPVTVKYRV
jgi:hypothetical protein